MTSALLVALTLGGLLAVVLVWNRVDEVRFANIALGAVLVVSLAQQFLWRTLAEDAFITFRYSENLARGAGPVFNEGERVEGYSNFLWMVLIAIPRWVAGIEIVDAARALGIVCALGTIVAVYALATRLGGDRRVGLAAAILTATAGTAVAYGPSGLETPGFLLLTTLAVLAVVERRFVWAGVFLSLGVMTRPDGLVVIAVVAAWVGWTAFRGRADARRWFLDLVRLGAPMLVLLGPWTIWRVAYYGHLVPNALAAKSGVSLSWQLETGRNYLNAFLVSIVALLILGFVGTAPLVARRVSVVRFLSHPMGLVGGLGVVYATFVTVAGGDWMPAWRFYAPVIPLFAVWIAVTWTRSTAGTPMSISRPVAAATFSFVAVLLVVTSWTNSSMIPAVRAWETDVDQLGAIGSWMRDRLPAGTEIATYANGSLSYHAGTDLTVVDLLGLTDEHIAREGLRRSEATPGHAAYDDEYIIRRGPSILIFLGGGYDLNKSCGVPQPYDRAYVAVSFPADGGWVNLLVKRDQERQVLRWLSADQRFGSNECP